MFNAAPHVTVHSGQYELADSSTCSECQLECSDPACCVFTSQCTDKCVVVPCTDPHEADVCGDQVCTDASECLGIDDFIQCCDDYHAYFSEPKAFLGPPTQPPAWDPAFDALLCGDYPAQPAQQQHFKPAGFSQPHVPPPASPTSSPKSNTGIALDGHNFCGLRNPSFHSLNLPQQSFHPQLQPTEGHICMWGDCKAVFQSLETLVSHVNLHHLRVPPSADLLFQQQADYSSLLSCHWGDCQLYPDAASVPGPSNNPVDAAIGVLANHLYHDHLGLQSHPPLAAGPSPLDPLLSAPLGNSGDVETLPDFQAGIAHPPTPPADHDCSSASTHSCKWKECSENFDSCEALMAHINVAHVGSGQKHYDCYWDECRRNGSNGFPSKQKICRHLQSHTGHRPYQCKICKQNFSEAATLQQHIRRHTQERPYICDFPDCSKAFAITGALTIHKRTHNGYKPFKCTYCTKTFSESSNLSKHLRTHTGVRPYTCPEPGCGKSFARCDQLTRHVGIHKKKAASRATAA